MATDFAKNFKSILDKLSVLRHDPRITFLMREWTTGSPLLGKIIEQPIGEVAGEAGTKQDIRILDISGLPNEVAGPLAAMLVRPFFSIRSTRPKKAKTRSCGIGM